MRGCRRTFRRSRTTFQVLPDRRFSTCSKWRSSTFSGASGQLAPCSRLAASFARGRWFKTESSAIVFGHARPVEVDPEHVRRCRHEGLGMPVDGCHAVRRLAFEWVGVDHGRAC